MSMRSANRIVAAIAVLALALALPCAAFADEQTATASASSKFYCGDRVNTRLDNGYSQANPVKDGDPHFGWELGRFVVTGFTNKAGDERMPFFLKNKGDQVQLSFMLEQDINALNGDEARKVSEDKDGKGEEPTEKRIYVGSDDVMKAAVSNNLDVAEVQSRIRAGESVDDNGKFVQASMKQGNGTQSSSPNSSSLTAKGDSNTKAEDKGGRLPVVPIAIGAVVVIALAALLLLRSRNRRHRPVEPASSPMAKEIKEALSQQDDVTDPESESKIGEER